MKKGMTELVFILDRSGSMSGLESDTIGGFNSMLKKQKAEPGEAVVTTVLFDSRYEDLPLIRDSDHTPVFGATTLRVGPNCFRGPSEQHVPIPSNLNARHFRSFPAVRCSTRWPALSSSA